MEALSITFRCVPRLEPLLPRPIPATHGLPDWLKAMPPNVASVLRQQDIPTVKQCPPFIDAMACGYLIPLATDVIVEQGKLSWDRNDIPGKAPIDFHENVQALGTPFFDRDRNVIKFMNFWTIETPPGYSVLITHPINRYDLPFVTVTGLVDSDRYYGNFVNFPARWLDMNYTGTLLKGTPIAQCIPVKRENWKPQFETMDVDAAQRLVELSNETAAGNSGVYRREFRVPKRT